MTQKSVIWTVGLQCKPEDEAKFNAWYDDVHVPMLLKGNLVKKATRFKLADETYHVGAVVAPSARYLTIYEFDSAEKFDAWMKSPARDEAGADKAATWGDGGYDVKMASRYDLTKTWNSSAN